MAEPHNQKDPTYWVKILIVVVVLLVIGIVLYNAISQKHAYDENQPANPPPVATSAGAAIAGSQAR